jgi:hypothetical protein
MEGPTVKLSLSCPATLSNSQEYQTQLKISPEAFPPLRCTYFTLCTLVL